MATTEGVRFIPPASARDTENWSKREVLELVKPILREHDHDPDRRPRHELSYSERQQPEHVYREDRWTWIYRTLRGGSRWLGQARREIACEDEYGHYWAPAWTSYTLIEDGWHKWEVEVHYPRRIRLGKDRYVRSETKRFRSKPRAERWAGRLERRYAKYIERLLAEGLYDQYGYDE